MSSLAFASVGGRWVESSAHETLPDPLNGEPFLKVPATTPGEAQAFVASLELCSKSGLHNPFKSPERYLAYGSATAKAAALMAVPEVEDFFTRLIMRVAPKSYAQANGEVVVTRRFLENFSGDNVRMLARSFSVPGDHVGQASTGYRWPFGPVAIVSPFNFPLGEQPSNEGTSVYQVLVAGLVDSVVMAYLCIEIPVLQLMGALYMGNKVIFKTDSKVSVVMEQTLRLFHHCGAPVEDVDFINCDGPVMHGVLTSAQPRVTQFTGSSKVAEILAEALDGKVKVEDAGFDWKILGPDVQEEEYVAHTCDQDAYAYSGQKCSAQSILFVHENWSKSGILETLKSLASRRTLEDLTVGPVLSVTTETCMKHIDSLLKISGAKVLFGGKPLSSEKAKKIPAQYGAWDPTAVFVPLKEMLKSPENFALCTTEIFGPFQVVTEYDDNELDAVLEACERMNNHLTAAVVSNDVSFQRRVLEATVNGTTYCGIRARTTGAPQNHWFGPAGDPRAAGIGTIEAIRMVWSCHREVIMDEGPVPEGWTTPART
ncbi:Aldehyde Dehydrogenase [Ectocarpus siliculosus]|uniref:Aldehyde Dehydrogenase n=1 Tax=Ectocarpus siliculosus TaxID=2880 RepID=D7G0R3_ECTSI|nr:Aldehyde Dehydrogenase [Ectocarpus siliculosus]|eukprot:CBJ33088.1 Aldehyde Dehydrogenase [Ectocarpus siliculosus]